MKLIVCLALFIFGSLYSEAPWGKNADLLNMRSKDVCRDKRCSTPILGTMGERLIQFHQDVISPADGPRSHFLPSSSQYTLDAMRRYGFFCGVALGCDRLMRENQERWVYRVVIGPDGEPIKWNPVR